MYLDISPLSETLFANTFSHPVVRLLVLLMVSFAVKNGSSPFPESSSVSHVEKISCLETGFIISLWMCVCHLSKKMVSFLKVKSIKSLSFCWEL